jgi:hypothetical protein
MKRILLLSLILASSIEAAPRKVMVLFDEHARHIDLVARTRQRIEDSGGRVRAVIGLSAILADVAPDTDAELSAQDGVRVYDGTNSLRSAGDAENASVVALWNRLQTNDMAKARSAAAPPRMLATDVHYATDLPQDETERSVAEAEYRRHWLEVKHKLAPELQRSNGVGCASNGAGF